MKISRLIVQALVVIAVIISFILTFFIMTNNSRYQMKPKTDTISGSSSTQKVVEKQDLYSPSQIVWNENNQSRLVYNNKHNVVSSVQKDMSKWKFGKISVQSKNNEDKYSEFINKNDTLQLFYPLQMSLGSYGDILNKDNLKNRNKYMFNRILFKFDQSDKHIYLGNDETHTIYKLKVNSGDSRNISKLLNRSDVSLHVSLKLKGDKVVVNYLDKVVMNPYSYLVTKQEDNSYISSLLGSNNISTRKSGDVTTYTATAYQRLVSDSKKNELTYYDYSKKDMPKTKTEILDKGYKLVNQINSPLSNARLSYVNWKKKVLVYREYVEGFPTFKKSNFGAVKISFNKSEQIAEFSNKVIQVPVPSEQKPVTLKPTKEILDNLAAYGYTDDKFEYIDLGYKWEVDNDNKDVVDLIPSYFIRYNHKWYTLDELIGVSDRAGGE